MTFLYILHDDKINVSTYLPIFLSELNEITH